MRSAVLTVLTVLTACARVQAPAGGPTDLAPPVLLGTTPDSLMVVPDFDDEVEFRFNEVISEGSTPNFGLGTGDLEKLILLSPSRAVPEVRWRRNRITVRPREGWRPNLLYRVELLPGYLDLSNNRGQQRAVVTLSTGAPLPTRTLHGRLVDWSTQRPHPRGLIEAVLLPDSLPYRTVSDSTGRFTLGPVPAGEYLVYGVIDQNNDLRMDRREPFDRVPLAAGRDSVGELWAFRHDTTAARMTAAPNDSISLALTFSQPLNPYQRVSPDSLEVLRLPDSLRLPVQRILPKAEYDTVYRARPAVDTSAAGRARADSIRADSLRRAVADSLRADSLRRAQEAARIRIPGAERQAPSVPDTAGRGPLTTKPALFDKLYARLGARLVPGVTYFVRIRGVENVSLIPGTATAVVRIPEARPTTDSLRPRPDTPSVVLRRGGPG